MRLSKYLSLLIMFTIGALFYVSQQVASTRIGYQINAQQLALDQTLDQRQMLLYNVCNLKSPENLQDSISKDSKDFEVLRKNQIIVLRCAKENTRRIKTAKKDTPRWMSFFRVTSLAEAHTQ